MGPAPPTSWRFLLALLLLIAQPASSAARSEWDLRNFEPGREERDNLAVCNFETRIAYALNSGKTNPKVHVHQCKDACEVSILFVLVFCCSVILSPCGKVDKRSIRNPSPQESRAHFSIFYASVFCMNFDPNANALCRAVHWNV